MRNLVAGAHLVARRTVAVADQSVPLPEYVLQAVANWRLLHDIPFTYLVPDERLLPPESIRFFHVDGAWLDALAAGALAIGAGTTVDQSRVQSATPAIRAAADRYLPLVRDLRRGRVTLGTDPLVAGTADDPAGAGPSVTGFLLRSSLVANWPALTVRAYTTAALPTGTDPAQWERDHPETVVGLLRLERLGPSVLVALFDGVPALVWLEEPHHGVQLGVQAAADGYRVPLRGPDGAKLPVPDAVVPIRTGPVPGVVDVGALAAALDRAAPLGVARGPAGVALCLLQPPARQRFAATST
jgi:hypothetical protein